MEQIDLLLVHQALPSAFDRTRDAYRALETLLADGKVRAIGVSNFMVEHLTALLERATVAPAVNQIDGVVKLLGVDRKQHPSLPDLCDLVGVGVEMPARKRMRVDDDPLEDGADAHHVLDDADLVSVGVVDRRPILQGKERNR